MIKIVTALKCEANPLIKYFKLKSVNEENKYRLYQNEYISLIITGPGGINSLIATSYFLTKYNKTDFIINIGTCGSKNDKIKLGEIFYINKIHSCDFEKIYYPDILIKHEFLENSILTSNKIITSSNELNQNLSDLIDMESYYYYSASIKFMLQHEISVIKTVSDHLSYKKTEHSFIEYIIHKNLSKIENTILKIIDYKKNYCTLIISEHEKKIIESITYNLHFTEYMKNEFSDYLKYYKLKNNNLNILSKFQNFKITNKNERNKLYAKLKQMLTV